MNFVIFHPKIDLVVAKVQEKQIICQFFVHCTYNALKKSFHNICRHVFIVFPLDTDFIVEKKT